MIDKDQLTGIYKQNQENDIILNISKMKGIENMAAQYLAEDLIENESELFD